MISNIIPSITADELRAIIAYIREKVSLDTENKGAVTITFSPPTEEEMIHAGLKVDGVKQVRQAPWWDEMITDIIETPDFCEPDDPPEQILEYAKDVVSDYIRKRFPLNGN
jgi:hypothetical protein